jgi:hypothetical protein
MYITPVEKNYLLEFIKEEFEMTEEILKKQKESRRM